MGMALFGGRRVGAQVTAVATYSVTFTSAGKRFEATLPEEEWRSLPEGADCHLVLGLMGRVKKVTLA